MRKFETVDEVKSVTAHEVINTTVLLECTQTENRNNDLIALLKRKFANRIEIVRGGSVAVEAVHTV